MRTPIVASLIALAVGPALTRAQDGCDPQLAARLEPELAQSFDPKWLEGNWVVTVWVTGVGVPDTVIAGRMTLRPRVLTGEDRVYLRALPLIGRTDLQLEYVPGIEPFRTPAISDSDAYPGVELRYDRTGARLSVGNPTAINQPLVSLEPPYSATFEIAVAFRDRFAGFWDLHGSRTVRAGGGYCAVREKP